MGIEDLDRQIREAQERNEEGLRELGKEFEGVIV